MLCLKQVGEHGGIYTVQKPRALTILNSRAKSFSDVTIHSQKKPSQKQGGTFSNQWAFSELISISPIILPKLPDSGLLARWLEPQTFAWINNTYFRLVIVEWRQFLSRSPPSTQLCCYLYRLRGQYLPLNVGDTFWCGQMLLTFKSRRGVGGGGGGCVIGCTFCLCHSIVIACVCSGAYYIYIHIFST